MGDREGSGPDPVHVWVASVEHGQRSAAHDLLLDLGAALAGPGVALRHDGAGRPWLERPPARLWASVSHGRGVVAVAASSAGPVGVDVESRRPFDGTDLARRWFPPAELAWLTDQPDQLEAFLQLWTAKEAVGKALGTGLRGGGLQRRMPLGERIVPGVEPALALLRPPLAADAVLTVAVPAATREVLLTEEAAPAGHGAARRSAAASRTSFPIAVRGN